jgi:hypothetical protein
VIGLRRADGQYHAGILAQSISYKQLQLAGLVATGRQAGLIVPLDPEFRTSQGLTEPVHPLQRCR